MNRPTDTRNPAGDMPSFLGNSQDADTDANFEDDASEDETTHYEDAESEQVCDDDYDENDYEEHATEDDALDFSPATRPTARNTRYRHQAAAQWPTGGMLMAVGMLIAVAGAATAFMPAAAAAMVKIIEPQIVVILGVALVAIATGMRRTARLQQRLGQMDTQRNDFEDELRDTLAQLAELAQTPNQANGEAPDVQHLMLSLQRQDQKINNLTKAIKMYGKPLMEIASQGAELAGSIVQVKGLVEGAAESTRQAVNRIEQQLRSGGNATDLGELPAQISKLEVSLAAVAHRLEDSEVRKSLVRLEDACKEMAAQVDTLGQGDSVRAATTELQQSLADATQGLTRGIEQMRDGNLCDLESSVRDIRRELAGVATVMSQVRAAVKNGVTATRNAPDAQPVPAAAASGAPPASVTTSTTGTTTAKKGDATAGDGYATGKRNVASKNVLGAIAKLKQMKG